MTVKTRGSKLMLVNHGDITRYEVAWLGNDCFEREGKVNKGEFGDVTSLRTLWNIVGRAGNLAKSNSHLNSSLQ